MTRKHTYPVLLESATAGRIELVMRNPERELSSTHKILGVSELCKDMERREVLAFFGTFIALPGCVSDAPERSPESESSTTTDECGWPQFCEGSTIVEVMVSPGFSGDVVLETGCREEDFELQSGDTKTIKRQVDAETCDVTLYINNQESYQDTIHDYVSTTLKIDSNGEINEERIEL